MSAEQDPFYVGYHPVAPASVSRGVRRLLLFLGVAIPGAALLLALSQRPADPGIFEYGHPRSLHGLLREFPYPVLLVPGDGITDRQAAYTRYLLVAAGKRGAQALARGLDGQWVDLKGTRIARPGREMLEVADGSILVIPPAPNVRLGIPMPAPFSRGEVVLSGEIVDSKCWLGVMKPSTGNVHRGCATRCVSGGIPPLLMTTDSTGQTTHYLLTDREGRPANAWFADLMGRQVQLKGELIEDADLAILRVESTTVVW